MTGPTPPSPAALPAWLWLPRLFAAGVLVLPLLQGGEAGSGRGLGALGLVAAVLLLVRPGMGGLLGAAVLVGTLGQAAGQGAGQVTLAGAALLCAALVWWRDRQRCTL